MLYMVLWCHITARAIQLDRYLDLVPFRARFWQPPGFAATSTVTTTTTATITSNDMNTRHVPEKTLADCVEAMIGVYYITAGLHGVRLFMKQIALPLYGSSCPSFVLLLFSPLAPHVYANETIPNR
jgi:dsRNA-specific ribonuclease